MFGLAQYGKSLTVLRRDDCHAATSPQSGRCQQSREDQFRSQ
jgi:hypothetical protein